MPASTIVLLDAPAELRDTSMIDASARAAGRMSELLRFPGSHRPHRQIYFSRREINQLLSLYSRKVARGEWRDYAIDHRSGMAVFSVFRRASEMPIYRIEKDPRLARKQGIYSVISATGLILRRGHELDRVLLVIDRKLAVV